MGQALLLFHNIFAYFRGYKVLKNLNLDEADFIANLKMDEKCEMDVILG